MDKHPSRKTMPRILSETYYTKGETERVKFVKNIRSKLLDMGANGNGKPD